MKKTISFLTILLFTLITFGQTIDFEQVPSPPPAPQQIVDFAGVIHSAVAFADIDNDNDLDVLIIGENKLTNSETKLYINDGNGNFTLVSSTPFVDLSYGTVAFADVDNDNDQDVLISGKTNFANPVTLLYTNDGSGNFSLVAGTPFLAVEHSTITFEDIDNDNDQDVLITGHYSNEYTRLYINDGNGNFTLVVGTPFDGVEDGSVAFSDIDNDNDMDVLITGRNNSSQMIAKLYSNDGNGNFTEVLGTPFIGITDGSIAFTDIDNDNDQDVLITGGGLSQLYTNDSTGNFTEVIGTPFVGVQHSSIAFVDAENDNDQDVLITGYDNSSQPVTKLYNNDGNGNYIEDAGTTFDNISYGSIAFADVNNDNFQDVLIAGGKLDWYADGKNSISKIYMNNGSGGFLEASGSPFDGVRSGTVTFADIDNDNDLDVMISGYRSPYPRITKLYNNDGSGNYTEVIGTPFIAIQSGDIEFADIDNDNDQDVLITGYGSGNSTRLYTNDGFGNYSEVLGTPLASLAGTVSFADIDNDNDLDVLITGLWGVKLYTNDGVGNFAEIIGTPFNGVSNGAVAFADIDNDNDLDVLITGNKNSTIGLSELFINDGNGNFTIVNGTPFDGVKQSSIAFSDIDNDNDLDVLITGINNSSQAIAKLYLNDGIGGFTIDSGTPFYGIYDGSIQFSDVDNDNDQDVLITGSNTANLYSNDGAGNFTLVTNMPFDGVKYSAMAFADIDNDNDQDVLISGRNKSYVYTTKLYRNISCDHDAATDSRIECDSLTWIDGNTYTSTNNTATYNIIGGAANGCNTFVSLDLTINNSTTSIDTRIECDSLTWIDGNTYTSTNNTATYNIIGGSTNGCDSLVTLDLTVFASSSPTDIRSVCDSLVWIDGNTYISSNNTATFNTAGGCLITLDLTINNSASSTDTRMECDSLTWIDGITYISNNNNATFNIVAGASNGCDSLVTLDLTINNSASSTDTRTECDSLTWIDGITYISNNNNVTFNIVSGASNGCDSLVTLDLTIINSANSTDIRTECDSLTWIDGNTYVSNNNTATFNIVAGASNGCDSLVTLDLTINNSSTSTDTRTECDSITWIDGITYSSINNTATFNIIGGAANLCDSLVTLDLTIINSTTGIDTRTECDSLTWIDGTTYSSSNNTATFNIIGGAANLCDSLVTLDLTIINSTTGIDTRTECDSLTWIDGINYNSNNNNATFNIIGGSSNGCDSLVTLNLTINPIFSFNQSYSICQGDSILLYSIYQNTAGVYYDSLQTINGCDSILSTTLSVNPIFSSNQNDTICQGDSLLIYGTYQNSVGVYYDSLQTINGCDSILSTSLATNPVFSSNQNDAICQGDSILLYGSYQHSAGVYYNSLQTINGCDSIFSTTLTVNSLPSVSLASFNPDTLCDNASAVTLPTGSPTGGNYSGNGVIVGNFDPSSAGVGTHNIIYTYTDGNSCINSDTTIITVDICTGIDNISTDYGIIIYPNPSTGQFTIEKPNDLNKKVQVKLLDATSKLILEKVIPVGKQKIEMDIRNYSKGIYYLQLIVDDKIFIKQILKN
ncbi:MAG: hypothetical protein COB15_14850 [Flavobacteriales bacterium]|nr:MAG: hypothetical protein COB15_14850 [Flavobacteriales bacterium]